MTRLGDKVKVAPLEPARVQRIEERVVASLPEAPETTWEDLAPEKPAWLRWAPAAGLACAVVLVAAVLGRMWSGSEKEAEVARTAAPQSTGVATKAGEKARLVLGDAVVDVGESTVMTVKTTADGVVEIVLEGGRVDCTVEPRPGRAAFAVVAADVRVEVVGTVFAVTRDGDEVGVEVTRGKVAVSRVSGERGVVAAGERWGIGGKPVMASGEPELEQATGDRRLATGDRRPEAATGTSPSTSPSTGTSTSTGTGKPVRVKMPDGLPALASCGDCWKVVSDEMGDEASRALYTLIYRKLETGKKGDRSLALSYIELYERRFPKGAELAAVKQLRKMAEK